MIDKNLAKPGPKDDPVIALLNALTRGIDPSPFVQDRILYEDLVPKEIETPFRVEPDPDKDVDGKVIIPELET